nr:PfkB family carbohydrate kinase [uncultured Rhodoferax sp.]
MSVTLTVVGGSYGEECCFPRRKIFRGSGGRSAALLTSLGVNTELFTATGPALASEFGHIAQTLKYKIHAQQCASDIWFRYRYPLGHPDIHPSIPPSVTYSQAVQTNLLLAFGMIEGRPTTHAKRAVYDPQDGSNAKAYSSNGSTADELAVVVSYSEGRALTGEQDPSAMAQALLQEPGVSVAIIKCGPQGALVQTAGASAWVYPFPTARVYKIGSGDIFSAAFAYAWLVEDAAPVLAAWFASRAAAAYVESGQDRFTIEQVGDIWAQARNALRVTGTGSKRYIPKTQIYIAGPFFNTAQQWAIDEIRGALTDMGFSVFSPIHDVGEGLPSEVAPADLIGLDGSGVVLALLDGLDTGTIFEVGYARAKGIPVIAIAESVSAEALTMVLGSDCYVTNDFTTGIYAACWKVMGDV